jgi:hypothetical protein
MARVARDPRHRSIKLLHASRGLRRLTEPWSMAMAQAHERPSEFAGRVVALRELHRAGEDMDPATVWRRLSTPMTHPGAAEQAQSDRFQRVMVCSAQGADSFELVRWLGQLHDAEVVHRRFAGSRADARDVATDYVDLACDPVVRRVIAMARGVAAEGHRDVQFLVDDLQRLGHAGFAHRAQAVDHGAADHRAARAQGPGLEHVLAAADAAVHPDLDLAAHRRDDGRQRLDARRRAVELAPAVVADDDGVGSALPRPVSRLPRP